MATWGYTEAIDIRWGGSCFSIFHHIYWPELITLPYGEDKHRTGLGPDWPRNIYSVSEKLDSKARKKKIYKHSLVAIGDYCTQESLIPVPVTNQYSWGWAQRKYCHYMPPCCIFLLQPWGLSVNDVFLEARLDIYSVTHRILFNFTTIEIQII